MRSRSFALAVTLLSIGSSACTRGENDSSAAHTQRAATGDAARSVLRAFPLLAPIGQHRALVARGDRLVPDRALAVGGGWPGLEVSLPVRADQPVRVALENRADVSLEVTDVDNARVDASVHEGRIAFIGVEADVDAVAGVRDGAVETVRVLRTEHARSTWRMRVVVGPGVATLRAREGRIEAVEPSGKVAIATAPLFALDAAGVERHLAVRVRPTSARTFDVDAELDARGLQFPVALDPLWSSAPSTMYAHDQHAATRLSDGRVLVTGGYQGGNAIPYAEIFDPATNTWSTTALMTYARAEHTATTLPDGRVFVAFGAGVGTARPKLNSAEIYDPKTNKWTDVTTTSFIKPIARVAHTATLLPSGEVFLTGGVTGTSPESTTDRQVLYNPTTGVWTIPFDAGRDSFMKNARAYHTAVLVGGKVFALGGERLDPTSGAATLLNTIESWTAATGWVLSPARLRQARCEHAAAVTSSGSIMLVGGGTRCRGIGSNPIAVGDSYDPATDMVATTAPALNTARSRHTLTQLPSGQLLVTGGAGITGAAATFFSSAEVFDGSSWTTVAAMSTSRHRHSATLLSDGRVLVVGSGFGDVKTAEVFSPTPIGSTCTNGSSCASGFCADGVCCDTRCDGNCESCAVAGSVGTCKPITGEPVGGRPKCTDGAGNVCAAKRCNGVSRDCEFVSTETTCSKPSCATGTAIAAATCDGAGACGTPTTKECAPYICGLDACRTDCTVDEQCVKGFTCADGACKSGASCLPDGTSKGKDGTITPCAPYRCGGDGLCMNGCNTTADCVTGATCDVASKVCVPQSTGSEDSGGCTTVAGHGAGAAPVLLLLGASIAARRRRRCTSLERA